MEVYAFLQVLTQPLSHLCPPKLSLRTADNERVWIASVYLFYHNEDSHQTIVLVVLSHFYTLYNFSLCFRVNFYNSCKGQMAAVSLC